MEKENIVEFLVGYWITALSLEYHMNDVVEISDEYGKKYEYKRRLSGTNDGKGNSIMDVHVHLDNALSTAEGARREVQRELSEKLVERIGKDISQESLEYFFSDMVSDFEEIYEEKIEDSIHNFMQAFDNFCKEL